MRDTRERLTYLGINGLVVKGLADLSDEIWGVRKLMRKILQFLIHLSTSQVWGIGYYLKTHSCLRFRKLIGSQAAVAKYFSSSR